MKNTICKITTVVLLVLSAGLISPAQTTSFKSVISELHSVQKQLVPDRRVAILDISLQDTLPATIVLKGKTDLPEARMKVLDLLKGKGIQFVDSVEVLPEISLGDKNWALVTLSVAHMRSGPDHADEMVTQALMGTPLRVLEYEDGWFRVQTPDQYIGWMEGNGLVRMSQTLLNVWKKSDRYMFNQISGVAVDTPDGNGLVVTDLVLGDLFEVDGESKDYLQIMLPDGRKGFVKKKDCLSWKDWTSKTPDVQALLAIGRQMLGLPYLWGGTSTKSNDCSGFSKTCYFSQAVVLARDASQQARYGEHPDVKNMESLQPGDLLFFGRSIQRVTHVGVYMGGGKYIHSSGYVRINSIDPNAPDYNLTDRKELVTSSRILNSLNTAGITLVKDHPWYVITPKK
jgi:SH3-like domain-containing protein